MTPLILGLTVCSLQGERGHKGFKVRALFSLLLCLSAATFIHHALTVHFICFSQGDKGFRGRDGTDGRKVSLGETNNAALTVISGLDVVSWCPFLIFIFLFVCSNQGEAGFPGLSGCKGSPGLDVSP